MKKLLPFFLFLLTVQFVAAQNVGIGTTNPKARLHVADSNVVFTGSNPSMATPISPPISGTGSRMMWYASKSAFRAGYVDLFNWDKDSIGDYSFATGYDTKASGYASTSMGYINNASGYVSTSLGYTTNASGFASTSMGYSAKAIGDVSTSIGLSTNAIGDYSTSIGVGTKAIGNTSTSMGRGTTASGDFATSLGFFTNAKSANSLVIGKYNDTTAVNSLFEIGNGAAYNDRTNALTVLNNGNMGIGTIDPQAKLHVQESSVLFTGKSPLPTIAGLPPASGTGTRMMWYADKAAFRAGYVIDFNWNKDSIGLYSFASGYNTKASGDYSISMGYFTKASGLSSTSMGYATIATGDYSTSMGYFTAATEHSSISMGNHTIASGFASTSFGGGTKATESYSTSMGNQTIASGQVSTSFGDNTVASGNRSTSMGYQTKAIGDYSISMGYNTTASGNYSKSTGYFTKARADVSSTMGENTIAKSINSLVIGKFNDTTGTNRLFEIGNGLADNVRANAITVLVNGNVGFGTSVPGFPLNFATTVGDKISLYGTTGNHYGFGVQSALLQIHSDAAAANIAFGYGSSNSFTERARIINQGEYGMTLTGRLQLRTGTNSAGLWLNNFSNTSNQAFIGMASDNLVGFYGGTLTQWGLTMNTTTGYVGIGLNTANPTRPLSFPAALGEKILLYPGAVGEVGIGVYGGELRLHCDIPGGKVSFGTQDNAGAFTEAAKAQMNGAFAFSVFGSLWANGVTYASDERFKQNITAIQSPLQKLLQINGVEYEMKINEFAKNHFTPGRQIGLLAQNVEKVVPEAVNEMDGYKGVDYAKLVPLLIEAIKEQNKKVDDQEQKMKDLQKQIEELKKMIQQK
jgi:hypothetical protein